jgi:hypothetical protein
MAPDLSRHAGGRIPQYVHVDGRRFGRVNIAFRAYRYVPDLPGWQEKPWPAARYAWLHRWHAPLA